MRKNIWMLVGAGTNIAASVGPDGVLLVNAGTAQASPRVIAAIKDLQAQLNAFGFLDVMTPQRGGAETRSRFPVNTHPPPKPVRYIIDTSSLPHSIGGNEAVAACGVTYTGGNVAGTIADSSEGAAVLAHENVLNRMVGADLPFAALPTETYFTGEYKVSTFFNEEGVQIIHVPNAATDGDSFVYFRGSDVIAAGDLVNMDSFPIIDVDAGGSINGVLDGLNAILKLAIPEFRTEGGTMVIPGHGRLGGLGRRRLLPRHAHDHPRSGQSADRRRAHARASHRAAPDVRLRSALRLRTRARGRRRCSSKPSIAA